MSERLCDDYGTLGTRIITALRKKHIAGSAKLNEKDFVGWMEGARGYAKFDKVAKKFMGKKLYNEWDMDPYFMHVFCKKLGVKY